MSGRDRGEYFRPESMVRTAFESTLGRRPKKKEILRYLRALESGGMNFEALLWALLDSPEYCRLHGPGGRSHRLGQESSAELARKLRHGMLSWADFDAVWQSVLPPDKSLIIGQSEYLRTHKHRFFELLNAFVLLAPEGGRVLEFGVSEFSRFYKHMRPGCTLVTSDRPTEPGFPGFTPWRCKAVSGCDLHLEIDLEANENPEVWKPLSESTPFDFVILAEVLEHLRVEPVKLIRKILSLLRPEGYLYISTPNFFSRERLEQLAMMRNPQSCYPGLDDNWDAHHHYREYSMPEMVEIIHAAGGKIQTCYFSDCWDKKKDRHLELHPAERAGLVLVVSKGDMENFKAS